MNREQAHDLYNRGCNAYLQLFCEKHDYDFEDAKNSWVANEVGGIACIADYFVDMQTIITDIEMRADKDEFLKWYDYCLDVAEFNLPTPNFAHWLKGCPRTSEESLSNLRAIKHNLERAIDIEKALRNGGDY